MSVRIWYVHRRRMQNYTIVRYVHLQSTRLLPMLWLTEWNHVRAVRTTQEWELPLFKHWKRTYLQILYLKLEFRLGVKDFRISICTINGFVGGSQTCGSIATYHNKSTWQSRDAKISYRFQHVQLLAIHIIGVRQAANKRYMSCRSIDFWPIKIQLHVGSTVSICD